MEKPTSENQNMKCPQITKKLEVAVYKVQNVEKFLSEFVANKSKSQNHEKETGKSKPAEVVEPVSKYLCPFCHQVYYTEFSLRRHKFSHKDELKCSVCAKRFKTVKALKTHSLEEHMQQKEANPEALVFRCSICAKGFLTLKQLQLHKTLHSRPQIPKQTTRFKCEKCSEDFILEKSLMDHTKLHSEEEKRESNSRPVWEVGEGFLAKHLLTHSVHLKPKEQNKSEECKVELEVESNSEEGMENHAAELEEEEGQEQSVPKEGPEKKQDSKKTSDGSSSEFWEPEEQYKNRFPCPHCTNIFDSWPGFRRHLLSHKNDLTCPFCDGRFKRKRKREAHIRSKHIRREEDVHGLKVVAPRRLFNCKWCPMSFWNKKDASCHVAFHKTKTPSMEKEAQKNRSVFRCNNCSTVFRHRSNWKRHLKQAHQEQKKEYTCRICGEKFLSWKRMRRHLEGHLD